MRNIQTPVGFAVVFDHDYPFRSGTGVVCELTFHNPDVLEALNKMFAVKKDEYIAAVEISRESIKAYFERKPEEIVSYPPVVTTQRKRKKRNGRTRH